MMWFYTTLCIFFTTMICLPSKSSSAIQDNCSRDSDTNSLKFCTKTDLFANQYESLFLSPFFNIFWFSTYWLNYFVILKVFCMSLLGCFRFWAPTSFSEVTAPDRTLLSQLWLTLKNVHSLSLISQTCLTMWKPR